MVFYCGQKLNKHQPQCYLLFWWRSHQCGKAAFYLDELDSKAILYHSVDNNDKRAFLKHWKDTGTRPATNSSVTSHVIQSTHVQICSMTVKVRLEISRRINYPCTRLVNQSSLLSNSWFDLDSHALRFPLRIRHKIRMFHLHVRSIGLKKLEW